MKKMAILLALLVFAGAANAGIIYDIQNGDVALDSLVVVEDVIVTGLVGSSGFFVIEAPYAVMNGMYVYYANDGLAVGDVVNLTGTYAEYNDLSEIAATAVTVTGTAALPAPIVMTVADLMADPEPYESNIITLDCEMVVTGGPDYGEWAVQSEGVDFVFDNFWEDLTNLAVDDCFEEATGVLNYSYGAFKLAIYEGTLVECGSVATETGTFGQMKALYR